MKFLDMHCDTISAIFAKRKNKEACVLRENSLHVDLLKLKSSRYLLQNFALFVDTAAVNHPLEEALLMLDLYNQELEKNKDIAAPVLTFEDIGRNEKAGKISCMLTLEDGDIVKGNLSYLRIFYQLGVRMITLTWNYENSLGFPNIRLKAGETPDFYVPETKRGLKEAGFAFLTEMERLGIIIDVSHLSDAGFYDVLAHTKKPFVASHSNARSVCPNIRNLTDPMIRALGERGGVTGLNFCPDFLTDSPAHVVEKGSIEAIVRHAKHIAAAGGIECLALGGDFDGIPGCAELPDASFLPLLSDALKKAGFTGSQLELIFYKNALRVYRENLC